MKKIFFALAALVLAFTGCSQEEDAIQVSEKKAVKVVVNMDKPGFGEDTRAPRQGWEDGDAVIVVLDDDFKHLIALMYDGTSWKETVSFFNVVYGDWENSGSTAADSYLASLPSSGDLKAIYCSSGISYFAPFPEEVETVEDLGGIDIYSYARNTGYYNEGLDFVPTPYGECIMTCEDGTYSASSGVLTLNITMKPQVAQFTIRDLSDDGDEEEGKLADGGEVGVGGLVAYSGGTITPSGIELNQVAADYYYKPCWVHPNTHGISIYAAVDSSYEPDADSDFISFSVSNETGYYVREFGPYDTYKEKVTNGAAIIMDGPTDETIAAGKWYEPA